MATTTSTHDSGTTLPDLGDAVAPLATLGLLALLPLAVLTLLLGVGLGAVANLAAGLLLAAVAFTAPVALPYLAVRVGTAVATRTA
jgi:hypothetical protein